MATYISNFVDETKNVKNILMMFRIFAEGAFIGAPAYFLRKLNGGKNINKEEKKKIIKFTLSLLVLVLVVEILLASM